MVVKTPSHLFTMTVKTSHPNIKMHDDRKTITPQHED